MRYLRRYVVPVTYAVTGFFAIHGKDKFALGDYADVLSLVTVRRYDGSRRIRSKQNIAALRLQFVRSKRPLKRREVTEQLWKVHDVEAWLAYPISGDCVDGLQQAAHCRACNCR